ncbi:MAG TPA: glycosyltransferase, partial [Myxococcota bacterium]|nr:glycosyltransferase [Myxococcota bacterium]
ALSMRALSALCRVEDLDFDPVPPEGALVAMRPLHGFLTRLEYSLETLWRAAARGGLHVIVGATDREDPALRVAARVAARWPEVRSEIRVAPGPEGLNRKLANLVQMSEKVEGDLLLLSDADIAVPEDYVLRLTRPFKDADVGLVTCPYRSVPAAGLASRLDALITNMHFLPSACLARQLEGLHFALGATIAVRATALAQAGGFAALLDTPADDFLLARHIEGAGWRLAWSPMVVDHLLEPEGWAAVARRHLRWARVVRHMRPIGYLGQLVTHGSVPALILASIGAGVWIPCAWWVLEGVWLWRRRKTLGLRPSDLLAIPFTDLLAFAVYLGGTRGRARPS